MFMLKLCKLWSGRWICSLFSPGEQQQQQQHQQQQQSLGTNLTRWETQQDHHQVSSVYLDEFILFLQIGRGKTDSAARNWIKSAPQTDATTFAFASLSILLLWVALQYLGLLIPLGLYHFYRELALYEHVLNHFLFWGFLRLTWLLHVNREIEVEGGGGGLEDVLGSSLPPKVHRIILRAETVTNLHPAVFKVSHR